MRLIAQYERCPHFVSLPLAQQHLAWRLNPNIDGHLQAKVFVNARPVMTMGSISLIRDGCLVTAYRASAARFDGTTKAACDRLEMFVSGIGNMSGGAIGV